MAKLPLPVRTELDARGREIYETIAASRGGRMLGLFGAMMHRPELALRVSELGAQLRFGGELSDDWREVLIVAVASELGCAYEYEVHLPLARKAGAPDELLEALGNGAELPADIDEGLSAALIYTRALCRRGVAHDAFAALHQRVGDVGVVVEVTLLVGYYTMLSQFLRTVAITTADDRDRDAVDPEAE